MHALTRLTASVFICATLLAGCGDDIPETHAEALRKSAEAGDVYAQHDLGLLYHNGKGVERDLEKAAYWWRKSAEQGDPKAQYNLGVLYHRGRGVEKDAIEAYIWFALAAENGITQSAEWRDTAAGMLAPALLAQAKSRIVVLRARISARKYLRK